MALGTLHRAVHISRRGHEAGLLVQADVGVQVAGIGFARHLGLGLYSLRVCLVVDYNVAVLSLHAITVIIVDHFYRVVAAGVLCLALCSVLTLHATLDVANLGVVNG